MKRNGVVEIEDKNPQTANTQESNANIGHAYIFLKDIVHNHQHHDPESDKIISVHAEGKNWRQKIFYGLIRHVVELKRQKTPENLKRSGGILAYAGSFRRICESTVDEGMPNPDFNSFNLEELKNSITSASEELSYLHAKRMEKLALRFTILFGVFGILAIPVALVGFGTTDIEPHHWLVIIVKFLAEKPDYALGLGIIMTFFVWRWNRYTRRLESRTNLAIIKTLNILPRSKTVAIILGLSFLLIGWTYSVLFVFEPEFIPSDKWPSCPPQCG